jgi:hypothetical protein
VPTSSPKGDSDISNIGTAAHICAASPGGPRYKSSMSKGERASIKNGIWLCTNCSREIDNDVDTYTEELLHGWKKTAEATAKSESGKKLPNNDDAVNQLTTALSGMPQKNFLAQAISNTHKASENALQKLDDRFVVKSKYENGTTHFTINAKETVNISLQVEGVHSKSFSERYRDLIEKGKDFEMSSEGISVSGSELMSQIMNESSNFKITAPKNPAIQKMFLMQESTGIIESLDDVKGEISFGRKSFDFEGLSCSDVFRVHYSLPFDDKIKETKFDISLQFEKWNGKDIRRLPFHEKLQKTFRKLSDGWVLVTTLEIDGIEIFSSEGMKLNNSDYVLEISSFLYYTELCKKIASAFNEVVLFDADVSYTEEEYKYLAKIVTDIEKTEGYSQDDLKGNSTCDLVVSDPDQARIFLNSNEGASVKMRMDSGEPIFLFGTAVTLPPLTIIQSPVIANVIGDYSDIKAGDSLKIELVPQENYRCIFKYEAQNNQI